MTGKSRGSAHQLGMRLMIDFHYSDSWADPGQQTKPAAWNTYSLDELQNAVAEHTSDVLTALKEKRHHPRMGTSRKRDRKRYVVERRESLGTHGTICCPHHCRIQCREISIQ